MLTPREYAQIVLALEHVEGVHITGEDGFTKYVSTEDFLKILGEHVQGGLG